MIAANHPINFISASFGRSDIELYFSRYSYIKDSLLDEREIFTVHSSMVNEEWLKRELYSLNHNQELAFHSLVVKDGRKLHVPMIDFSIESWDQNYILTRMQRLIDKKIVNNMFVYDSGRSYHAYSSYLLTPTKWLDFMGRILLINPVVGGEIIDSRWVGHRIIGRYSSLRLSCNTDVYKKLPTRIKFPE